MYIMHQMIMTRWDLLAQEFPNLRQPAIVGEFSLDSNREFLPDRFTTIGIHLIKRQSVSKDNRNTTRAQVRAWLHPPTT